MSAYTHWQCGQCAHTNDLRKAATSCTQCHSSITHHKAKRTRCPPSTLLPTLSLPPQPTPSPAPALRVTRASLASRPPLSAPPPTTPSQSQKRKAAPPSPPPVDEAVSSPRPKRLCAAGPQQRLNEVWRTKKAASTSPPHPAPSPLKPSSKAPAPPAVAAVPIPSATVPPKASSPAPLASPSPAPAPAPYVPATLPETLALLQSVLASLAPSSPPPPSALPSRASQLRYISDFLSTSLTSHTPGALYLAGRPGVGKSLTVDAAVRGVLGGSGTSISAWRYAGRGKGPQPLPATTVVSLNAMAWREGGGKFWPQLLSLLRASGRGRGGGNDAGMSNEEGLQAVEQWMSERGQRGEMVLLIVDEMDALLSSPLTSTPTPLTSHSLLSTLLRLTSSPSSPLILLSISNNIRLLDPLLSSLSASHSTPHRVVFSTYTPDELRAILAERLGRAGTPGVPFFHPSALELVTRQVGKDTGDIRRCLRDLRLALQGLMEGGRGEGGYDPKEWVVTAATVIGVRAGKGGGGGGKVRELSHQQAGVLWVVGVKGGGRLGGLYEAYKRAVGAVRGGLAELSEGELTAVVDVLESVGMCRKVGGKGRAARVECGVTVDALKRELSGEVWDQLWGKAEAVRRVRW